MPTIPIPDPFRPIHFAARQSDGEVRIFIWNSLDDAVRTLKTLVPHIRLFLTAEHVRGLATPDYTGDLSLDEFAALWFAKTVYDPGLYLPNTLDGMYDAEGAANYAKRLITDPGNQMTDMRSPWSRLVLKLILDLNLLPKHPLAQQELMLDAILCKNCDIPPVGLRFPHDPPNWLICCPICGSETDPREGVDRRTALEAWDKGNGGARS